MAFFNLLLLLLSILLTVGLPPPVRALLVNDTGAPATTAHVRNRRIFPDLSTTTTTTPSLSNGRNGESTFGAKTTSADDLPATSEAASTRTIQRMVGGHLHHPAYRKYEEIAVTRKNTRLSKVYFHKKTDTTEATAPPPTAAPASTTVRPVPVRTRLPATVRTPTTDRVFVVTAISQSAAAAAATADYATSDDADNDDAELLTDDNRLDSWPTPTPHSDRLLVASAGAGPEKPAKSQQPKDDSKKTLSDQVAEGKYGLIQTELFAQPPRRPGILSYAPNAEVPADTVANLGGLHDDDIWLAEDHLLVLKGGGLSAQHSREPWRPIDDYQAPQRQVRLPANPRVPPPFLVQLDDGGPVQFVGNHQLPLINPFTNESLLLFPGGGGGFPQAGAHNTDQANVFARPRPAGGAAPPASSPPPSPAKAGGGGGADLGYQYLPPLPPWLTDAEPDGNRSQPGADRGVRPLYTLPPIMRLPFPVRGSPDDSINQTAEYDEDDPALYYPPPYSFTYDSNYTNPVAPGPLVPGIVLPPPPNFFTRANELPAVRTSTPRAVTRVYKPISRTTSSTSTTTTTTTTTPKTTTAPTATTSTTLRPTTAVPSASITTTFKAIIPTPVRSRLPDETRTIARPVYVTTASPPSATPSPSPPPSRTQLRKVVQSPVVQSPVLHFVSKDQPGKATPVYYEYFDARDAPAKSKGHPQSQRVKTTTPTVAPAPTSTSTTTTPQTTTAAAPIKTIKLKPQRPHYYSSLPTTQLHPQKRPYNAYLPLQPFDYDRYVYITPQPEIIPNGISNDVSATGDETELVPLRKVPSRPAEAFHQEVNSIRQTLQFFRHAPPSPPLSTTTTAGDDDDDSYVPGHISTTQRSPKAKAVYEYSFEAASVTPHSPSALLGGGHGGHGDTGSGTATKVTFLPPAQFDDASPFKPMVQYSAPLNDANGFKAMPPVTSTPHSPAGMATHDPDDSRRDRRPVAPVFALTNRGHAARNYKDPLTLQQSPPAPYRANQFATTYYPVAPVQRRPAYEYTASRFQDESLATTTPSWVSIEKQIFRQIHQQQQPLHSFGAAVPHASGKEINVQIQPDSAPLGGDPYEHPYYARSPPSNYYHYPQLQHHQQHQQQQHQFPPYNPYAPTQQPYFRQTTDRRQQLQQQQHQQQNHQFQPQHPAPIDYDLSNDTAVNYINPRPPINPDAEFIDPYLLSASPQRIYQPVSQQQQQQQQQPFPPPLLPGRYPSNGNGNSNRFYPPTAPQLQSLAKDVLVNYKLPLPPLNANAEYLPEERFRRYYSSQQQQQHQHNRQQQRQQQQQQQQQTASAGSDAASSNVVRYKLPGEPEANVYFYTPTRRQQQQQQQHQQQHQQQQQQQQSSASSTQRNNN